MIMRRWVTVQYMVDMEISRWICLKTNNKKLLIQNFGPKPEIIEYRITFQRRWEADGKSWWKLSAW